MVGKRSHQNPIELPTTSKWVAENFVLGDIIGSGSFGRVYKAQSRKDRSIYALKVLGQTSSPKFLAMELRVMSELGGKNNVISMCGAYRDGGRVFVVMEYFPHDEFKNFLPFMTVPEKLFYFKNLLIALEHLHQANIIHRDVKPGNFLYNRRHRIFRLIDFGLSEEYKPKTAMQQKRRLLRQNVDQPPAAKMQKICNCSDIWCCDTCQKKPERRVNKAGTPGFRPPEVLLRFDNDAQSTAIDIWAAGILLLSLLFKRHPLFRPADDFNAICQIAAILGSEAITDAAKEHGISAQIPKYPGVDIGKLMKVVRPGWPRNLQSDKNCKFCFKIIFANTKGRCFCKKSENETNLDMEPRERMLVSLTTQTLDPNPSTRKSATSLLSLIEDFEYCNSQCYDD